MASEDVRRAQVGGAVAGLVVGGVFAFVIGRLTALPGNAFGAAPAGPASVSASVAMPAPATISPSALPLNSFPEVSFAQQGEDLVIKQMFASLGISNATYLDVGAYDPIKDSNTYLFYALGSHGVLVEPNPAYAAKLRKARPRDVVLEEGIGINGETSADYYEFAEDEDNTFSKEQADKVVRLGMPIKSVVKMRMASVDDVIAANFGGGAPSLLSIDTEGLDLAILKTLDFHRFRPPVVCVETLEVGTSRAIEDIATYMRQQGYAARGGTFVNTIFVDEQAIARADAAKPK